MNSPIIKTDSTILFESRQHWIVNIIPGMMILIGSIGIPFILSWLFTGMFLNMLTSLAIVLFLVCLMGVLKLIRNLKTKVQLRKKQLTLFSGLFNSHITDIMIDKYEGLYLTQSILGRVLNYGKLHITTGGVGQTILISQPFKFRELLNELKNNHI